MKNVLTLFMIVLFANFSEAQNNDYTDLWKKVERLEIEGLPKSALEIVETIQVKAKYDNNENQIIKALIFKSKFALTLEEDAQISIINNFKTSIERSQFPVKNILESMLANLYWQYFQRHRYQFYNRSQTAEKVDENDFRTWDLQTLFNEVHLRYQKSLESRLMLQLVTLEKFNALLLLESNSKIYRPTLYDFLAHNALEFYKTEENSITKPAYKFELDNTQYLSDPLTFSQLIIKSKDSTSLQLNAIIIYKNLTQFHLKNKSSFALADVDIQRLKFVKQHATFSNKEDLFLNALKSQSEKLKAHEVSGLYNFEIAQLYFQEGNTYEPTTNDTQRWKLKESLEVCDLVIQKFPKSKGANNCAVLKSQILQPTLQITSESFIPNEKDARLLIQYKNHESLDFKVFKLSRNEHLRFKKMRRKEEQFAFIKKLKIAKQWHSKLRNENDYQIHNTEVLLPALSHGYYIVLATPENNSKDTFTFATIQISDMALVERSSPDQHIYQIIDRNNGAPISNAKITLNYERGNLKEQTEYKTTNSRGEITVTKTKDRYWNLGVEINYKNQKTYFDNYRIYGAYHDREDKEKYKGFVFTDRSIYRPGQTVYFKAIAMKAEEGKSEVIPNELFYVDVFNTNDEKITVLELMSNEYGSVSGEFIIPNGGLNGQYNINFYSDSKAIDVDAEYYFSVEEYKRPKFETNFNPITETFKINDSVTIKGHALAYAGSNITDAKVVYRVHRKVQYPRWYYWYRPWFTSEPQEITHGEAITNDKGEFEITFKALPDESVDKTDLPIFNYEVVADVTDLNGETHSATTIVNVGYHALTAKLYIPEKLDKTQKNHELTIDTKNLNGEFVAAKGSIKIYKLKAPHKVLRPRPWKAPDYQEFSKETFNTLFPHDAYANEDNPDTWGKSDLIFESDFNTENSKILSLGNIKRWVSGQYVIVLESKDKFGQSVKDEIKTIVFSSKDKTLSDQQLFSITTDKSSYNINDEALVTLASATNVNVTLKIEKDKKIVNTYVVALDNSKQTLKIPVSQNDLGGFAIHYSFAAFNSFQGQSLAIAVPYPQTDLEIETLSFRDKLQPGTDETWSFKIKGAKGEKVSAELLASMYDASLDQFKPHQWQFNPIQNPVYYSAFSTSARQVFRNTSFRMHQNENAYPQYKTQQFDKMNWFGFYFGRNRQVQIRGYASAKMVEQDAESLAYMPMNINDVELEEIDAARILSGKASGINIIGEQEQTDFSGVTIRKNLQETAFFFPNLITDKEGNIAFSFTSPEALTKWKLQLLAHTKTLENATTTLEAVTQKELMVIPNAPRFLRQGDRITISTKIANISDNNLEGQATLLLTDVITGKDISEILVRSNAVETFSLDAKGNTQVSWDLTIPDNIQAVQYKIIAKAGDFSDGEQNALPVLSNRMLVTETLPMWIRSNASRSFTLDKLKTNTSTTLKHHKLTLEMTSNPAWYAVQALPYLMEYPYECNEQTFSRYYANALASHIANSNPRIQEVFNQWRNTDALLSNLEKNQELKSLLIQETPWLRDAQSESEQKKRIALLFDLNKMNKELQSALTKLKSNQSKSGAWPWFNGGRDSRYITQHIITGFGHLKQLNVTLKKSEESSIIDKAINYLDSEFIQEYKDLKKYNKDVDLSKDHLSYTQLHYLYMRSFFPEIKKPKEVDDVIKYYNTQIQKHWLKKSLYAKGLMALVVNRMEDATTSTKILKSLKENSITSDELGMYWKANTSSWYWYQAPIETQALMIEVFSEVGNVIQNEANNLNDIDNLKIWLLKNKQTNQWKTTKATTEAVYALLLQGNDWLSITDMVDVAIGGQAVNPSKLENVEIEAGTGYYKTAWNTTEIKPEMAEVKLTKKGNGIAWGSLYWQYFEDLDKITSAETPLKLKKQLFLKTNTDTGEQISEIKENTALRVGDLVRVRIELRSDRNMEFIHMKDMRASGLEPVNVISQFKWQDGLGYYESTKDASTNFFFDYLPKGVYVFEYDLRINNAGDMSNGITTIQSMYAPEFSSHSEGVRIEVKNAN